jgi:hypothetical protein
MSTLYGKPYSTPRNVNLKNGILRFDEEYSSNPLSLDTGGCGLYINDSNQLIFWNKATTTILGGGGSLVNYSLDDAYDDGSNIAVDTAAVALLGASDGSINILEVTLAGAGTGNMIDIQNNTTGSAGYDIIGTDDSWSVSSAGAAVLTAVTGCDTLTAASDLAINATGTGTIDIGDISTGAVTITPALTAVASITITGSADSDVFTITDGDVKISNGIVSIDSDDTATGNLTVPSSAATSGNVVTIVADDLTTGAALFIDSDNGAAFSGNGGFIHISDGTDPVFKVGRYGTTTIAGNALGTNSLVLTAGDLTITSGDLIMTAGSLQVTRSSTMDDGLVRLNSTATGALGAVLKLDQTADSAADNDVIGRILFTAQDDADAAETYGRIDCIAQDVTAANPDGSMNFLVDRAGTNTLALTIGWDDTAGAAINGIAVGDGSNAAIVSSNADQDLTLETNGGTDSGVITITDGANGDITLTPNGTGQIDLTAPSYGQITAGADSNATLTIAMVGLYTIGNTDARTLTLPAAATSAGAWYTIKKTSADADAVTIDGNGDELIDGATTFAEVDAEYDTVTVVCDGTGWHVVSKIIAA